jgi:DNA repair ATPase RecN
VKFEHVCQPCTLKFQLAESERKLAAATERADNVATAFGRAMAELRERNDKLEESERKVARLEAELAAVNKLTSAQADLDAAEEWSAEFGAACERFKAAKSELEKLRGGA